MGGSTVLEYLRKIKYLDLKLCFTVYAYVYTLRLILINS